MSSSVSEPPDGSLIEGCSTYATPRFFLAWKGVIFAYGQRAGLETVRTFAQRIATGSIKTEWSALHGVFWLVIHDRHSGTRWHGVDNAGLYHAYYTTDTVSTRFLTLLSDKACSASQLAPHAIVDFLTHGGVHWRNTFVNDIKTIGFDEIIETVPTSANMGVRTHVVKKVLSANHKVSLSSFIDYFNELALALQDKKISVDLTGGIDSRLIVCLLNTNGVNFEVAVAGRAGIPDVLIAKKAAAAIGKEIQICYHDASAIVEELPQLFRECDGLGDVLAYHRSHQMSGERRRRGIEVVIGGAGGELYKDFWWLQDWPFYNSRRVNFARLYDLRICPRGLPAGLLAGDAAAAYAELRGQTIKKLATLRGSTNTESYDNIYFFYKIASVSGQVITNNVNNYFGVVVPFLEYDNVLFGTSLPRSLRFLNRFHRMMLTERCPELADVLTTEGVTARIRKGTSLSDPLGFVMNRSRRLIGKIAERILRRRWMGLPDPNDPEMVPRVRQSTAFRAAVEDLKDAGILNPDFPIEKIENIHVGRILTLGMLLRHVGR